MFVPRSLLMMVVPLLLAACGGGSTDHDDAPLAAWQGDWQAAEPLFLDAAADAAYRAVHDLRPEYSVDEIRALFRDTADVDYTSLHVDSSSLRFSDGPGVVCEGRYAASHAAGEGGDAEPNPESYTDFTLVRQTAGDCANYQTVSITSLLPSGTSVHFHIVTSGSAGRLHPPPWNPSVWPTSTTPESFAQMFVAAAPAIAGSLPPK